MLKWGHRNLSWWGLYFQWNTGVVKYHFIPPFEFFLKYWLLFIVEQNHKRVPSSKLYEEGVTCDISAFVISNAKVPVSISDWSKAVSPFFTMINL